MKKMFRVSLTLFLLQVIHTTLAAQTIYTDPEFPVADAPVTVFFNAEGTPLEDYTGDVYTHTGVTVGGSQWQYVIGNWNNNANQPQLTKIGTNLYELEMTPSIRDFYGVPASGEISEMCFVFRASGGAPQTVDLFVDVYPDELGIIIQQPAGSGFLVEQTDLIDVKATSPLADSMFIYIGDEQFAAVAGITLEASVPASQLGEVWAVGTVTVVARNETDEAEATFTAIPIPPTPVAALPAGAKDGVNYIDGSTVVLSLYAPLKKFAFVTGEFNGWEAAESSYMNRTPDGDRFWLEVGGLTPGQEYAYQYFVDGSITISDPYAELVLDPWNDQYIPEETYPNLKEYPAGQEGLVAVLQTNQQDYVWQHDDFEAPAVTDLVAYELLIRDFLGERNYQTLTDTLTYLKRLGVNAIELMPVNEFDGNISWGYNPNHFFAVDKYYGTRDALKAFVDACHGHGIAVILDVVFNHATDLSPYVKLYWDPETNSPAANSPFYNVEPTHDFNVFNDMNHESPATQQYISRAVKYWLEEYRVDGYRFDLSKGFTQKVTIGNSNAMAQYDQDRIDILTAYADSAWAVNPDAYVILEHFADNSEEKVLASHGCMLWGNSNYNYNEATMGYHDGGKSDFSWMSYQKRGWADPHVMGYMESHDEERLMAKNLAYGNSSANVNYDITDINVALKRIQLAAAFFFTIPGPKMIWQFGELGYDYNLNYPGDIGGDEHKLDPKPVRWDYQDMWNRKVLFHVFSELIHLKKTEPAFETDDFSLAVSGPMKRIQLNHDDMNVTVVGNFDVDADDIAPLFQHTGWWYDYFGGDSLDVTDPGEPIMLMPGEYRIYTDKKFPRPEIGLSVPESVGPAIEHLQVFPNPSDDMLHVNFTVVARTPVQVAVKDMDGRQVALLAGRVLDQGGHGFTWDLRAAGGARVAPGIYFLEVTSARGTAVEKVMVR